MLKFLFQSYPEKWNKPSSSPEEMSWPYSRDYAMLTNLVLYVFEFLQITDTVHSIRMLKKQNKEPMHIKYPVSVFKISCILIPLVKSVCVSQHCAGNLHMPFQ